MIFRQIVLFTLVSVQFSSLATGFTSRKLPHNQVSGTDLTLQMSSKDSSSDAKPNTCVHPSELPGDPSLVLVTNLDLGDKKLEVMKKCSKAISEATGKPEAYIGVSITDNASVLFGYVNLQIFDCQLCVENVKSQSQRLCTS